MRAAQKGAQKRVTGAARFVYDIQIPNMLYGKIFGLPCPRAKIKNIGVHEALSMPGVVAVYTAHDFSDGVPQFGPEVMDQPVLAVGETKFQGQPVAVVVAESEEQAKKGRGDYRPTACR